MVSELLGINKWRRFMKIIVENGGILKSLHKLWKNDALKEGKLMGVDSFGNKYFENRNYMIGRSRWVEFNPAFNWDYDASQVTAEWYGWLHYKTDRLPSEDCAKFNLQSCSTCHCWLQPHLENKTATEHAYYPYSTTRPKINVWDGTTAPNPNKPTC